jgi:hypothetical protein
MAAIEQRMIGGPARSSQSPTPTAARMKVTEPQSRTRP